MKTLGRRACTFLITIILTGMLAQCLPAYAQENVVTLDGVRFSCNPTGYRAVMDISGSASYTVQSLEDTSRISLDIYDARVSPKFKPVKVPKDKLIQECKVEEPNFRQVTVQLCMAYGVPAENVKVSVAKNPDRIIIDVHRDYEKFQQFHLTKNIVWMQMERAKGGRFTLINELFVRHKSPTVSVDLELAKNGKDGGKARETVDSMVRRTGAIAGINAGYFSNAGDHLSLVVKDSKVVAPSVKHRPPRTVVGMDVNRNLRFDRVVDKDGKLITTLNKTWTDIIMAVGAGPRLLTKGKATLTINEEAFGRGGNDITRRTGRTALGVNNKGFMVMTTISGFRDNHRDGVFLSELADYLIKRHVIDALNLDGGGSTNMAILGTPVSQPPMAGTYRRPVTNAVLVYDTAPIIAPYTIRFEPEEVIMEADGKSETMVKIKVTDKQGKPVPNGTILSVSSGYGAFSQRYYTLKKGVATVKAHSVRAAGDYAIRVDCGPARAYLPVRLVPGAPASLVKQAKDVTIVQTNEVSGSGANRQLTAIREKQFIIEALVRDEYKNPLAGQVVTFLLVDGQGTFSSEKSFTRKTGIADTAFTLKSPKAKIQMSTGNLEPIMCEVAW